MRSSFLLFVVGKTLLVEFPVMFSVVLHHHAKKNMVDYYSFTAMNVASIYLILDN